MNKIKFTDKSRPNIKAQVQSVFKAFNQQQNSFKIFVASISQRQSQKQQNQLLNPEQYNLKNKKINKQKITILQRIKKQEDYPALNFHQSELNKSPSFKLNSFVLNKPNQGRKNVQAITQNNSRSLVIRDTKNQTRFKNQSQLKESIKLKGRKYNPQSLILEKSKQIANIKPYKNAEYQLNIESRINNGFSLQLSRATNVFWNPQKKEFNESQNKQQKNYSSFLLQLLKVDSNKLVAFILSQTELLDLDNFNGKSVYKFFDKLFTELNITALQSPLVKKYNNCLYFGQKQNPQFSHAGIIYYMNGNVYLGQLVNFQKHGQGIQVVPSKNITKNSLPHGLNINQNFVVYQGRFYKNSKSGLFMIKADDFFYQGQLIKGIFHGKGQLITQNQRFVGCWNIGQKLYGRQQSKKLHIIYDGQYKNSKFHGKGKLKSTQSLFQGDFYQGVKQGHGILVTKQFIYQGQFLNDKKSGKGIFLDKIFQQIQQKNLQSSQKNKIFEVQFDNDEMIYKKQYTQKQEVKILIQNYQSLSLKQTEKALQDVELIQDQYIPSKILNIDRKQKLPKKLQIKEPEQQKMRHQYLNFNPCQPQQQYIHAFQSEKKHSYLQGNKKYVTNYRNHRARKN